MADIALTRRVGTRIKVSGVATRAGSDVATDPQVVRVWIRKPDAVVVKYTYTVDAAVSRTSAGLFVVVYTLDVAGVFYFDFIAEGAASDVVAVETIPVRALARVAA